MIDTATDIIRNFHGARLAEYGPDDPRVVWNSRHSQESRFAVLAEVDCLEGASLLDVGCGLGDFAAYLKRRGIRYGSYLGVDINPAILDAARAKYPDIEFELRDLTESPFEPERFDYVFESGIFNIEIPDWQRVTFDTLRQMFRACRKGAAMNFLSRLSGNSNPQARYFLPSEIVAFAEVELSNKFILRHDYRTNDFTLLLYK